MTIRGFFIAALGALTFIVAPSFADDSENLACPADTSQRLYEYAEGLRTAPASVDARALYAMLEPTEEDCAEHPVIQAQLAEIFAILARYTRTASQRGSLIANALQAMDRYATHVTPENDTGIVEATNGAQVTLYAREIADAVARNIIPRELARLSNSMFGTRDFNRFVSGTNCPYSRNSMGLATREVEGYRVWQSEAPETTSLANIARRIRHLEKFCIAEPLTIAAQGAELMVDAALAANSNGQTSIAANLASEAQHFIASLHTPPEGWPEHEITDAASRASELEARLISAGLTD